MALRSLLVAFLAFVIYPAWLAAGFFDYLHHRKTGIEHTTGPRESWLHLAEFATLAVAMAAGVFLAITPLVLVILVISALAHTALGVADVSYTIGRRHISSAEQHVHGVMTVLPAVAVGIVAMLHWDTVTSSAWALRPRDAPLSGRNAGLLLGSYLILAGIPIAEELVRTSRRFGDHQVEHRDQRREGHHAQGDPPSQV